MSRGMFITLEGGEGAGKSTNLLFARQWLQRAGHEAVVTREPGGTDLGERVREILLHRHDLHMSAESELLLMFAARAEHIAKVIRPALTAGKIVLCDRFTDASYAYQGGARGIPAERIAMIEQWVQADLRPDLTLLFDVPIVAGRERAGQRSEPDRFERENNDFFQRVRETYLARAAREPQRIRVIDASQALSKVEQAIADILEEAMHGR
ncbi:MAG: dTMP kinase [Gammaproteobacteria bacterium]|nr:dTMP kinase [Gammaproteobacteria bacterium]